RTKKRVTIYTAGSLNYSDYDADIIIVDECHELATDNYRKLMMRYNPKRSYAFSATVNKRADNADFLIEEIFGPVIFEARYNEAVIEKSVVPIRIIWYRCDSTVTLFKFNGDIYEYKKNRIWRNDQRNRRIVEIANQFVKNNKQVLILVDTIEHALNIERFDNEMIVCCRQPDSTRLKRLKSRGLNVDKIVNSAEEFEKMIENFRSRKIMKMVATDVLSTGVSFEDLEVLIRADAKASKIFSVQAPGRVSRNSNAVRKETGIVVDLYDSKDKLSMKYAKERYKQYKEVGWSQEDSDGNSVSVIFESKTLRRYNKQRKSS
ncbi:MAG: helicase-related protein, partial [Nitrososphaerota archaeon]